MATAPSTERAAKEQYLLLLKEKARRAARRKFWTYYPDDGPLARHLYKKHMAFFELGAKYSTRGFIAGNRVGKCITGDTVVDTPYGEPRMVRDITGPHWVWAWDGKKKVPAIAHKPFAKPPEMAYRVWLSTGQFVDCAAEHRFLTEAGWLFLSDLFECVPRLPGSTEGVAPHASLADALHCLRTGQGSTGRCSVCSRQHGEQLRSAAVGGQAFVPSQDDAQQRIPVWSRVDDLVGKGKRILSRAFARLSSLCAGRRDEDQCFASQGQGACNCVSPYQDSRQEDQQSSSAGVAELRPSGEDALRRFECAPAFVSPDGLSNTIVCYQPIGVQVIYDFHVPKYLNYCTAGFVHHNTEGGGGFEVVCHLTGLYPDWWKGHRFDRPNHWWVAGDTNETVRDITQAKLCGTREDPGTGLIPGDLMGKATYRPNSNGAMDTLAVKHVSGGWSTIGFKSYEQGRKAFQGVERDGIWLDEESNEGIRAECVLRLMTTRGLLIETFTPLSGITPIISKYFEDGLELSETGIMTTEDRAVVMAGWDDVPHLSEDDKRRMLAESEPHLREARSKGIPSMGAGAIYPIKEEDVLVEPFALPAYWTRGYAMDVGWNRTAVVWGALDRDTDTLYLVQEHYRGMAEPAIHASAIKARGPYEGVIDPAARGRSQIDGSKLIDMYKNEGLKLHIADNAVEAGLYEVWQRLSTGRLKIFSNLTNLRTEYRMYRRDDDGKIVKKNDHLMDAMRYLVMSKFKHFKPLTPEPDPTDFVQGFRPRDPGVGY